MLTNDGAVFTDTVGTAACSDGRCCPSVLNPVLNFPLRLFHRVPLVVANLGMSDQLGYKTESASCTSPGFSRAVRTHR